MGAKLSILSLFRPSSQALNSFLLNSKAHVHSIALNVSICYINTYLQSEGKAYIYSHKKRPYTVIIHTDIPVSYYLPFNSFFSINY